MDSRPQYINQYNSGELARKTDYLNSLLSKCSLCPHECNIDRTTYSSGKCRSGSKPLIASYCVHHGEEPVLGGSKGVGNIFFANCNLKCCYCQNYQISQSPEISNNMKTIEEFADIIIELQNQGVTAVGFVSPSHFIPQILSALLIAIPRGLNIPLIYNSNGYDKLEILKYLDGIFDIYLPDFKYGDDELAQRYSGIKNYFRTASDAILEMARQVGTKLIFSESGNLIKGLIIRHLVLPNNISESENIFKELENNINNEITISIMSQYFPSYKSMSMELLDRPIRETEYEKALRIMHKYGFENGWIQEYTSKDTYKPDFNNKQSPFINVNF